MATPVKKATPVQKATPVKKAPVKKAATKTAAPKKPAIKKTTSGRVTKKPAKSPQASSSSLSAYTTGQDDPETIAEVEAAIEKTRAEGKTKAAAAKKAKIVSSITSRKTSRTVSARAPSKSPKANSARANSVSFPAAKKCDAVANMLFSTSPSRFEFERRVSVEGGEERMCGGEEVTRWWCKLIVCGPTSCGHTCNRIIS